MANKNLTIAISLNARQAQGCFAMAGKLVGVSMPPVFSSPSTETTLKRYEERNPLGDKVPHRVGRSVVTTISVRTSATGYQVRSSHHQHRSHTRSIWQSSNELMPARGDHNG
jgi:hypothetical protein